MGHGDRFGCSCCWITFHPCASLQQCPNNTSIAATACKVQWRVCHIIRNVNLVAAMLCEVLGDCGCVIAQSKVMQRWWGVFHSCLKRPLSKDPQLPANIRTLHSQLHHHHHGISCCSHWPSKRQARLVGRLCSQWLCVLVCTARGGGVQPGADDGTTAAWCAIHGTEARTHPRTHARTHPRRALSLSTGNSARQWLYPCVWSWPGACQLPSHRHAWVETQQRGLAW